MSSEVEPFRITMALFGDPVVRRAAWNPPASASVKMKTQATRAIPRAVSVVLTRRAARFLRLYASGMSATLGHLPERARDLQPRRLYRRREAAQEAHHDG